MNTRRPIPRRPALRPLCLALAVAGLPLAAAALPRGAHVTSGAATVQTPSPTTLTVTQTSQNASIDWLSFSIAAQERVNIVQPNASAVLLNRVTGVDPTVILGRLSANGRVLLSNPRGILFGAGSQVDAGSLLATTLRVGDKPDAQGRWSLTTPSGSSPGSITADGTISAPQGTVALVAPQVSIGGTVDGRRVGAAAASSVLVDVEGDGLIFFKVRNDEALDTRLDVLGTLRAEGGSADLRAQARAGFAGTVLNVEGLVQSRGLSRQGGEVMLDGGTEGMTFVSGTLDASAAAGHGGNVTVLGQKVGLIDHARVDASGPQGGGLVRVGGGWQGQGTDTTADHVFAGPQTTIRADARDSGQGGTVVLWSEVTTRSLGTISARGGEHGGDGGAVETSSHGALGVGGRVDVGSRHGRAGQWLLDPASVTISADPDGVPSEGAGPDDIFPDTSDLNVNVTTLENALADFALVSVRTNANGTGPGTITLLNDLDLGTGTLRLVANGSILLNANITASAGSGGNLILLAGATDTFDLTTAGSEASSITQSGPFAISLPRGTLSAVARDAITLQGPLTVGGTTSLLSGGTVSLTGANAMSGAITIVAPTAATVFNSVDTTLSLSTVGPATVNTGSSSLALSGNVLGPTGDLNLVSGPLSLGALNVARNMTATAGGPVTQSAALNVGGALTIDAGTGNDVTLDQANVLAGPISVSAGGALITNTVDTTLTLATNGDTVVDATGRNLTLSGSVAGPQAALTTDSATLTLGTLTVAGDMDVAATSGVAQSGPLTVTGTLVLDAPAVALNAANALSGPIDLTATTASLVNTVDTTLVLTTTGPTLVNANGHALNLSGSVSGANGALTALADAVAISGLDVSGDMSVTASSQVAQTAALTVGGTLTANGGSGNILLTRGDNRFGTVSITGGFNADVRSDLGFTLGDSQVLQTLSVASAGDIAVNGTISGTTRVVKAGSGRMTYSGPHTYTGDTEIQSGTLELQSSEVTLATLFLQIDAGATLALGDGVTLANTVRSQGGTLSQLAGLGTLTTVLSLEAGTTTLAPAAGSTLSLAGGVIGGQALEQNGPGTVAIGGPGSDIGALRVRAGQMVGTTAGSLAQADAVQIDAGAGLTLAGDADFGSLAGAGTLALGGARLTVGSDGTSTSFSGTIAGGAGGITKVGDGTFTLGGSNSWQGATIAAGGTLATASAQRLPDGSALQVQAGGRVALGGDETVATIEGAGRIDLAGHRLTSGLDGVDTTFSGVLAGGSLTKQGNGVLTLAGASTLTGTSRIADGTLRLVAGGALNGNTALAIDAPGTLDLQADATLGALTGSGGVTLTGATLGLGAGNATMSFDGVISGTGTLRKLGSGLATLTAASTLQGLLDVVGGRLLLQATWAGPLDANVAAPGVLQLGASQAFGTLDGSGGVALGNNTLAIGATGADSRFAGTVSGSGGLVKQGGGTLVLAGANTYSGGTRVNAGTLQLGDGGTSGDAGTGPIANDGLLQVRRSNELLQQAAITGSGDVEVLAGTFTLASAANAWSGATTVSGGRLQTRGAERLPDGTTVTVAAGATLSIGGSETVAAIDAAGNVITQGSITTAGDQRYGGGLQIGGNASITLTADTIVADSDANQLGSGALGIVATNASLRSGRTGGAGSSHADLRLGDVTLADGGNLLAGRLTLAGLLRVTGGTLALTADAVPDPARSTPGGGAVVPGTGRPLVWQEDTVTQAAGSRIDLADGATLQIAASGGGSVQLLQDANHFGGLLTLLSGPAFGTAWNPQVVNGVSPVSRIRIAGDQLLVAGEGFEADTLQLRADFVATLDDAVITARMPLDRANFGTPLAAPSLTLELRPGAFALEDPFGSPDFGLRVSVGASGTGPAAGYVAVLPKNGAGDDTAVFLVGPEVGSGAPPYVFVFDGASSSTAIPVFYNGFLPETPQVTGALSSVDAVAEEARRERFEEAVRTENVTRRLRKGVIAEVGPGRSATEGPGGAATPAVCTPADKTLQCEDDAS